MKILIQLEEFANKILLIIGAYIQNFASKYTPLKIKNFIHSCINKITTFFIYIKNLPRKIFSILLNKIKIYFAKIKDYAKGINIKEKGLFLINYIRSITKVLTWENFKSQTVKTFGQIKGSIQHSYDKLPLYKKNILGFILFASIVLGGTTFGIYKSVLKKFQSQNTKEIVLDSKEDLTPKISTIRAPYFRREYQYVDLDEVNIPVYVSKLSGMKLLVVDVVIEASNRYIPQYFIKYEHEIKDHLYTNLEPVIPGFPLEIEGKRIIRNKLKDELNMYLQKKKISGNINAVHIQGIIAD